MEEIVQEDSESSSDSEDVEKAKLRQNTGLNGRSIPVQKRR